MREVLREIKKHLAVYKLFAKTSLMQQLEYRANFIITILAECTWLASKLMYAFVVQKTGSTVGGLSPDQVMLFVGTFIIMTAFYTGTFMNSFGYIPWHVRRGDLDMLLVKPISTQFHWTLVMTATGGLLNYYALIPAYAKAFAPMDVIIKAGTAINPAITDLKTFVLIATVPFNLLKGVVSSIITLLIYKGLDTQNGFSLNILSKILYKSLPRLLNLNSVSFK